MEREYSQVLAIDIGNTRTKMARFEQGVREQVWNLSTNNLTAELEQVLSTFPRTCQLQVGWISVAAQQSIEALDAWRYFDTPPIFTPIESLDQLPIEHAYATPDTLGIDRIVGVIAAQSLAKGRPVLVIDAGTAITYDYADVAGIYQGGGISAGIQMRFQALHTFTARLPLVELSENIPLVGNTTHTSIRSGVINGSIAEVQGMITEFLHLAGPTLQVFLTGGDILTFENRLKKVNFADPYLLLNGIHIILNHISTS